MLQYSVSKLATAAGLLLLWILQSLPPNTLSANAGDKTHDKVSSGFVPQSCGLLLSSQHEYTTLYVVNFSTAGLFMRNVVVQYFGAGSITAAKAIGLIFGLLGLAVTCDDMLGRQSMRQPWSLADVSANA